MDLLQVIYIYTYMYVCMYVMWSEEVGSRARGMTGKESGVSVPTEVDDRLRKVAGTESHASLYNTVGAFISFPFPPFLFAHNGSFLFHC